MIKTIFEHNLQNEILLTESFLFGDFQSKYFHNPLISLLLYPETSKILCQNKYDDILKLQEIFNVINNDYIECIDGFFEIPINLKKSYKGNINIITKQLFFNNFDLIKNSKNNNEITVIKSILNHPCFNSLSEEEQVLYTDFVKHVNGSPNINKKKTLKKRI